jgi:hypothetical protein
MIRITAYKNITHTCTIYKSEQDTFVAEIEEKDADGHITYHMNIEVSYYNRKRSYIIISDYIRDCIRSEYVYYINFSEENARKDLADMKQIRKNLIEMFELTEYYNIY